VDKTDRPCPVYPNSSAVHTLTPLHPSTTFSPPTADLSTAHPSFTAGPGPSVCESFILPCFLFAWPLVFLYCLLFGSKLLRGIPVPDRIVSFKTGQACYYLNLISSICCCGQTHSHRRRQDKYCSTPYSSRLSHHCNSETRITNTQTQKERAGLLPPTFIHDIPRSSSLSRCYFKRL
jgi:hypothetical protein